MGSVVVFSPAKINLFLAVTGRRADGYHDLVSLVAPLDFGDTLWLRRSEREGEIEFTCDDPDVPVGADNLVVRAAAAYREAAGVRTGVEIRLAKRLPMGAGLGGGSSNAVAALRGLETLFGGALGREALVRIGAGLGSDCALFFADGPCVMRGRGERVEPVPPEVRARLVGRRVLVFKPGFAVSTPWAYGQLAAAGGALYVDPARAERMLADAMAEGGALFNSFSAVVERKFVALPLVAEELRRRPGVGTVLLAGSGSACFALLAPEVPVAPLVAYVREALGPSALAVEARLA
jgi:4-diphosphocytidyl-2-C-methyl-D-erythritol kinase